MTLILKGEGKTRDDYEFNSSDKNIPTKNFAFDFFLETCS